VLFANTPILFEQSFTVKGQENKNLASVVFLAIARKHPFHLDIFWLSFAEKYV